MWETLPLEKLLISVWLIDDEDRRRSLVEEGQQLQLAYLYHYAQHAPKELSKAATLFDTKLSVPVLIDVSPGDSALADAKEQLKHAGRY